MVESKEKFPHNSFGKEITDEEIDEVLGRIHAETPRESNLVEELREQFEDTLSGKIPPENIRFPEQEKIIFPDEIEQHPNLVEAIQQVIRNVDYVKNILKVWKASIIYRSQDGAWLVDLPGRQLPLPLDKVLVDVRDKVLKPLVRAQRRQGITSEELDLPIE